MLRPIKFRLHANSSKYKNEKNTCNWDTKRSLPLRPSLFKSSKTRWMLLKRSLRATSMRDWSSVRPSTINFSRDTKMWKKRLRISRILRGSSLRRLMEVANCLMSRVDKWDLWWEVKEVAECPKLLATDLEWEALVILLPSRLICEWIFSMDLISFSKVTIFR